MIALLIMVAVLAVVVAAIVSRAHYAQAHTVAELVAAPATLPGELGRFVAVLNSTNSENDANYVSGLERLRSHKNDVLADATRLMSETPEGLFALRHSVMLAVAALRDVSTLDLLSKVALNPQPLPPKEAPSGRVDAEAHEVEHDAEDVVQVTMVALDAVDGIEMLADDGHSIALDVLVEATRVDSNAVRGAALTALAARDDRREHLQRALSTLPPELRPLAGLRRAQIGDVPQIRDPRVHLAGKEQGSVAAPVLPEDAGRHTSPPAPDARGAPLIRRR
ncbi:MAG: hypothetical protein QOJ15_227 [Bradyrhizobium sp.]|nr:hypothetical protein [Bradyrhizobium sp.]